MEIGHIVPALVVVPIVGLHDDGGCGPFLGTGFFVNGLLVTCDHVLNNWSGGFGFSAHEDIPRLYKATTLYRDLKRDIAILRSENYNPPQSLPLARGEEITLNQFVCSFEYGTTLVSGRQIHFTPANRMGNVTQILDLTD